MVSGHAGHGQHPCDFESSISCMINERNLGSDEAGPHEREEALTARAS